MSRQDTSLRAEMDIFEQRKLEWLRSNAGSFVVIGGTEVQGFYPDYESAFRAGLKTFGVSRQFLVKQVCAEEPVHLIY